ncbi:hypothetical protein G7Y89_g3713 [Cudoniella acicularis]|uniref:G domain-containing protein n=1 Tax=Cudoniella acicularis TaxID=354080 RepID=A0A8H4RS66_9HELO|nr:hypothetical protein G7Y89_g3713 [Cudoniella acicularis]
MEVKKYSLDDKDYGQVLESYDKSTFYPADILAECPKFRILVIGQTGAGKTTICRISHHSRGTQIHQVWNEITFPGQNEDIILHDSGGFEAGNEAGFEEIQRFIESKLSASQLPDQLHCIWYCIPLGGPRPIQTSEEKFFQEVDVGDIPVIAVFTHFDEVENKHEFALMKKHQRQNPGTGIPADLSQTAHALAVRDYDEIYLPQLKKVIRGGPHTNIEIRRVAIPPDGDPAGDQGISDLIETTFNMLDKEGSLRRLWTSAQKQSADLKRHESIEIAIEYVRSVNVSNSVPLLPFLGGGMFAKSFNEILCRLIFQWGLIDTSGVLKKSSTRRRLFEACLKLSKSGRIATKVGLAINIAGPFTLPLITAALLKAAAGLILIFEDLFWKQREQQGLRLTTQAVEEAANDFANGKIREAAAAQIDGSVTSGSAYRTERCRDILTVAIRVARDERARNEQAAAASKKRGTEKLSYISSSGSSRRTS